MYVKIYKIIIRIAVTLLSILVLILCVTGCDRFGRDDSETKRKRSVNAQPAQVSTTPPEQLAEKAESIEKADAERRASLPRDEYGRDNPFERIIKSRSRRSSRASISQTANTTTPTSPTPRVVKEVTTAVEEIDIGLSAVLGNVAILMIDGSSRSVSTGDTISGLKVSDVKEGEVTLERGSEKFTVKMGAEIKVKAK